MKIIYFLKLSFFIVFICLIIQCYKFDSKSETDINNSNKNKDRAISVVAREINKGNISTYLQSSIALEAVAKIEVVTEISGFASSIKVNVGTKVVKGDLLVILKNDLVSIALEKVSIQLEKIEQEIQKTKPLFDKGVITEQVYSDLLFQQKQTVNEFRRMQRDEQNLKVRAQRSGIITHKMIENGQYVNLNSKIFTIMDTSYFVARLVVAEKYLTRLKVNMSATVTSKVYPGVIGHGTLKIISPIIDPISGTLTLEIHVKPDSFLRPGLFVDVLIVLESSENTVVIPVKSIIEDEKNKYVFVVKENKAKKVEIKTGIKEGSQIEVTHGLSGGEQLVIVGHDELRQGDSVLIVD